MFQCTPSVTPFCLTPFTIFHISQKVVFIIISFTLICKNIFTKIHHLHCYHINFTKHKSTLKHQPEKY